MKKWSLSDMLSNLSTSHLKEVQTAWPKFDTAGREKRKAFFFGRAQTGESQLGIQKQVKKKVMQYRDDALQKKQQQLCYSEKKIPSAVPFWGSPQQIEFTRGFYVGCPSWHNTSIYPKLGLARGCNHPIQLLSLILEICPFPFRDTECIPNVPSSPPAIVLPVTERWFLPSRHPAAPGFQLWHSHRNSASLPERGVLRSPAINRLTRQKYDSSVSKVLLGIVDWPWLSTRHAANHHWKHVQTHSYFLPMALNANSHNLHFREKNKRYSIRDSTGRKLGGGAELSAGGKQKNIVSNNSFKEKKNK